MLDECFESIGDDEMVLRVHVQPGAGRSALVGKHGDAVKARVAAPPVEGRANAALLTLLAQELGVKEDQLTLVSGESSRSKRVRLAKVEPKEVLRLLDQAVEAGGARGPGR